MMLVTEDCFRISMVYSLVVIENVILARIGSNSISFSRIVSTHTNVGIIRTYKNPKNLRENGCEVQIFLGKILDE